MQVVQLVDLRPINVRYLVLTPPYAKLKRRRVPAPIFGRPHDTPRVAFVFESPHQKRVTLADLPSFRTRNPTYCVELVVCTDGSELRVFGRKQESALLRHLSPEPDLPTL